ncbi:UNVERIFIED_CONTAM: 40S ribosomal protein S3-2 [Sesamum calycinum]|uniref:40S ribosomal protein S3-2 n=1 Tax=Sesamum calycinum TaxID=2727403 RepID=A0AAW2LXK1_9LAMI
MGLREATAVTEAGTSNSNSDEGPSGSGVRRFPLAAQPEIMRAAEKDDQYASFVYDACRDAFRHLFGTRVAVAYQSEFVADGVFFAELNEVLTRELAEDGYSGVEVRVTPMRTEIIIRATRTQNVLGEKGRRIRELTSVVQKRFKFPENSVELYAEKVNNRGLCAIAQAESLRYKLLGGLAVRRACYGVLRFVMESGAKGCEVIVSGKLRAQRAKSMKFKDGYMISSGQPVKEYIDSAVRHVLLRQGVLGIKVKIMLDWDPKGKQGPMTPLPDLVTIHPPKEEEYIPQTVAPAVEVA